MYKLLKTNLFFLFLLIIIVFAVYYKSISFDFSNADDDLLIKNNINYISNIKNIPNHFLTSCYYTNKGYYRPILSLSFSLDSILFKTSIERYRITNIILFALALYLMYVFLINLNLNKNLSKFIIILLSVHPILASASCWIPARNDTLLLIFLVPCLIYFLKYINTNNLIHLLLYYTFFLFALFTKETTVILLLVLPAMSYFFKYKINKTQLKTIFLGSFVIILIYFILRLAALNTNSFEITTVSSFFSNIFLGTFKYIEKLIYFVNQPISQYRINLNTGLISANIIFLIFISYLYFNKEFDKKIISFGLLWFIIFLLPTYFIKDYIWLPHRIILPIIGLLTILIYILDKIINNYPFIKKYILILFILLFPCLCCISYHQEDKFINAFVYYSTLCKEAPLFHAHFKGLAAEYAKKGDFEKYKENLFKAYELSGDDRYIIDKINILLHENKNNEVEILCMNLLDTPDLYSDYKLYALKTLIKIYIIQQDFNKAFYYIQQYCTLNPNDTEILITLAKLYAITGKYQEAINILLKIEQDNLNNDTYYFFLSNLYEDTNDLDNAKIFIKKALELSPENNEYKNKYLLLENKN